MAEGMWDRMMTFLGFEEVAQEESTPEPLGWRPSRDELARRRRSRGAARNHGDTRDHADGVPAPGRAALAPVLGSVPREQAAPKLTQVMVFAPRAFDDAQEMADQLRAGRPVILNLENAEKAAAQRLIDFVSGSTYVIGGEMHKIGSGMLMFLPQGVEARVPVGIRLGSEK